MKINKVHLLKKCTTREKMIKELNNILKKNGYSKYEVREDKTNLSFLEGNNVLASQYDFGVFDPSATIEWFEKVLDVCMKNKH